MFEYSPACYILYVHSFMHFDFLHVHTYIYTQYIIYIYIYIHIHIHTYIHTANVCLTQS